MTIEPEFYTMEQTEAKLNQSYQVVRGLVRAGILIQSGRGKGCLISAESLGALIAHMKAGGDKWEAPKMRIDHPPAVRAVIRRMPTDNGGRTSPKMGSNNAIVALRKLPPKQNARSLKGKRTEG